MKTVQTVHETTGVTVNQLATIDLGPEIAGMEGRQLRMRIVTIEPGGVIGPIHNHIDRPGVVYILQGTITDHRNGVAKEWAGPRIRIPHTGSKIGEQFRQWKSQWIYSINIKLRPNLSCSCGKLLPLPGFVSQSGAHHSRSSCRGTAALAACRTGILLPTGFLRYLMV
jgi:hypothetical protein